MSKKTNPNLAVAAAPYDPAINRMEFPLPRGKNIHVQTFYTEHIHAQLVRIERVQGADNGVTGYVFKDSTTKKEVLVPATDLLSIQGSPKNGGFVNVAYIYRADVLAGGLIGEVERGPFGLLKVQVENIDVPVFVPYHRAVITK